MNVWDLAGIELATPGSAVRHASVARHVTDCATRSSKYMRGIGPDVVSVVVHYQVQLLCFCCMRYAVKSLSLF